MTSPSKNTKEIIGSKEQEETGKWNKWGVLIAIGIGTFMAALDGSVVNTILPTVRTSLNSDVASIEWVVTVYLLVLSGLLLSFGRLGDMQGHKAIYLSGFAVFLTGSMLCSLASSVPSLIIFRGAQALGGAMLSANSPAILTKSFPASQRGQALGLQATMTYLGLTTGPSLGGWLADVLNWRAVFFINIPVGLFALWLSWRFIPSDRPSKVRERFDLPGALLFISGLIALLLGLNRAYVWGWTSLPIILLLISAAILLFAFIRLEKTHPQPMLDLSLFSDRLFSASTGSAILNYLCVYSVLFLMPFYLADGLNLSSSHMGLLLTSQPVIMAIVAPVSGTLSDRFGTRIPATFGMTTMAVGLYLLSQLGADAKIVEIAIALGVVGLGTGIFISPNNSALLGSAPRHRQGIAAGILATARNVGMVLGVGLSGAIFTTLLSHQDNPGTNVLFEALRVCFLVSFFIALTGAGISALRKEKTSP